jgi:putative transposase
MPLRWINTPGKLTRRRALRVTQQDAHLLPRIQPLNAEHPCWGYRRIWASRRCVEQAPVHKKRILRLMREHQRLVPPNLRLRAKRTPTGRKPRPTKPNEWWGTDMTRVLVQGFGWVSIVVVLDWYTETIVGYAAGPPCQTQDWFRALDTAVNRRFPEGVRGQGVSLMSDHGRQPTSAAFMQACELLGIHQALTSADNPKGNTDTERVVRTIKEECLWRREWTCPLALVSSREAWFDYYNEQDLHSALGDKPPRQFERDDDASHSPPFAAA